MSTTSAVIGLSPVRQGVRRKPVIPSTIFATLVFVVTETMFFVALISAFVIIKAKYSTWEPPAGVILPVVATAFNTVVLFISGFFLYLTGRAKQKARDDNESDHEKIGRMLVISILLGGFFVVTQGVEWVKLISFGLTMKSSIFGACFFLLIGMHGLHALAALGFMVYLRLLHKSKRLRLDQIHAMQVFWYFVVGLWPLLYGMVYF